MGFQRVRKLSSSEGCSTLNFRLQPDSSQAFLFAVFLLCKRKTEKTLFFSAILFSTQKIVLNKHTCSVIVLIRFFFSYSLVLWYSGVYPLKLFLLITQVSNVYSQGETRFDIWHRICDFIITYLGRNKHNLSKLYISFICKANK